MSEEPLAIGSVLLGSGILMTMIDSTIATLIDVHIKGWAWLLILVGRAVIVVRLSTMVQR